MNPLNTKGITPTTFLEKRLIKKPCAHQGTKFLDAHETGGFVLSRRYLWQNKGITPIIAVILLLMMTIAIAGLAYTWLQRTQTTIQTSVENTTTTLLGGLKVNLKVDGYNTTCTAASSVVSVRVYGRNAGTEPAKNLQLYIADGLIVGASNTTLNAGVTTSWLVASGESCSTWINRTRVVKISSDETTAEKSFTFTCGTGSC